MENQTEQFCPGAETCPIVTRRDFIAKASAALAAFVVLGGCGDSGLEPLRASATVQLAEHPELADIGSITRVFLNGSPVGITRVGTASFASFSLVCPHEGATIGTDTTHEDYVCPKHGATFDASGNWIAGQHTRNLTRYTTTFDVSTGTITITP